MKETQKKLCDKVLSGDPLAFEQFVKEYTRQIHHFCYRILFDENEAQEITQLSFFKFYEKIQSIKKNCKNYLYQIARNSCYDVIRQKKRIKNLIYEQSQNETFEEMLDQNNPNLSPPVEDIISFNRFNHIIQTIIGNSLDEIDSPAVEALKNQLHQAEVLTSEERLLIKYVLLDNLSVSEAGRILGLTEYRAHNMFRAIKANLRKLIPDEFWIKK